MHSSHSRSDRFKVVKIESAEPFKRGRWECMDFLDQSYNRIFQHTSVARQVASDVNINLHSSSTFRSELHRALSQANWGSNVDLHGSMLQLFYRQNNNIVSAEDVNRSRNFLQSVSNVCQPYAQNVQHSTTYQSATYHNHVLMPGMVTSSLVGIKYPLELNFMIDETTRESMSVVPPQVSNSFVSPHTTRHPFSFPFKGQMLNQVHCCNVHSSNVIDSHFKRDIQKFQNMSSDQSHFVQQNDVMNTSVAQNSNYSCSPHQQDQLNNETFMHNNVSVNHNGRARNGSLVDNGNQQTFLNKMVYPEQITTCHVSNTTDNTSTMHRYSSDTPNNNEFNNADHRNFNMNNTQIYGSMPPVVCQPGTNFQEQHVQHPLNNQVPISKNLINNNHITMPNQHTQTLHTAQISNGANYTNENVANLPNSNIDISAIHVSINASQDKEQNITKYTHSPLYSVKSKTHISKSDCDNAISSQMPSRVNNNNELNNSVNNSAPQYSSVKSFTSVTNNGNTNSVGNQTVPTNGHDHSNQYYVPAQVRPPAMQNIHYISNVSNQSNSHTNIKLNENNYITDSPVIIPSYLSSSLVFPIISNQLHVPLCQQMMSPHGNLMPNVSEQTVTDSAINKKIQSVNSNMMVQHISNSGLSQNVVQQPQNVSSCVHSFLDEQNLSGNHMTIGDNPNKSAAQNSIDTKIEALMDLVKKHLKFAVLEDVNVLKQKILMLKERVAQLEYENELLRRCDNPNSYKDNV